METWKPVVGWEGIYEVSDLGRVKRVLGGDRNTVAGRILRQSRLDRWNGRKVALCRDGRPRTFPVHKLVAEAFLGPRPPDKPEVNHLDTDRSNNRLSNLEYTDSVGNKQHSMSLGHRIGGTPSYGEANGGGGKLTEIKVQEIRRLYATGQFRQIDLGKMFGVSQPMIGNITRGQSWAAPD